jgi:outer membrane protein assembly factor BamB
MRANPLLTVACCVAATWLGAADTPSEPSRFWPQWRGPDATGVAPHGDPPVEWSESKNLRWKLPIPGAGSSSPIVWGDRVFVSTSVDTKKPGAPLGSSRAQKKPETVHRFALLAIGRRDGRVLWDQTLREAQPHGGTHKDGNWATGSPMTDGQHVYAYFGSDGLYCLDMEGRLQWQKDLGDMTTKRAFGEGSSPVLSGDTIVVNWDHEGDSFVVALNKNTGDEIWRVERDEVTSWATPLVVTHDGRPQVVVNATGKVRSYDLQTGKQIWETAGMTDNVIPSPVAAGGVVFVTSGFRGNALLAIRLAGAKGDLAASGAILWQHDRDTPYVPSPLLYRDTLYFLKSNSGILSSFDAKTGQPHYKQRLADVRNVYASPVGANGRVYLAGRQGNVVVIEAGPEFRLLASNSLDDGFDASPAIVDSEIYLRGAKHLYCVSR